MLESKQSHIRILGKRSTNRQVMIYAHKLHTIDKLSKQEIASRLNASRPTVDKYLKEANKLNIQSGFNKPTARSNIEIHDADFMSNTHIEFWIKSMDNRATGGKAFGGKSKHLANMYNVCKTLKVNPETFLSGNTTEEVLETGRQLLTNFIEIYKTGKSTVRKSKNWKLENVNISSIAYAKAQSVRDFMRTHGHPYPKGEGGVMSQSITPFHGKYPNLSINIETVDLIKAELISEYGLDSDYFRFFVYGLDSMARNKAIFNALNDHEIIHLENGNLIFAMIAIETKTSQHKGGKWNKRIWDKDLQESIKLVSKRSQHVIENRNYHTFIKKMTEILKEKYRKHGLTSQGQDRPGEPETSYFIRKPIHVLRHAGVQRLLLKTEWNIAFVAKQGWHTPQELVQSYGEMPAAQEMKTMERFF